MIANTHNKQQLRITGLAELKDWAAHCFSHYKNQQSIARTAAREAQKLNTAATGRCVIRKLSDTNALVTCVCWCICGASRSSSAQQQCSRDQRSHAPFVS
eukprot:18579-Heterococcus_DN1.PRE.4